MIQQTTALRKIAGMRKKIWGIQGGQGAGKTFSILLIIVNHALLNANKEIYIASAELTKMRDTVIKDFLKIVYLRKIKCDTSGMNSGRPLCLFTNGSFIRFIGLDKEDVGKGLRSDLVFVNEANKTNFDTYRELTSRAKRIIVDFNPNKKFWFHTELLTRIDCEFLKLTYLDNEQLSEEERTEILMYKEKGFDADGNVINQYWANMWRVYGLGEIGQVEGRIYNWSQISVMQYNSIDVKTYSYSDWGKVDPWAIGNVKYFDGNLYVHELNYESENEIERNLPAEHLKRIKTGDNDDFEGMIGYVLKKCGIPTSRMIVCDNNRQNKIRSARRSGWEYAVAVGGKTDLINRIGMLSGLNVFFTETSKNIEFEQENYCYDKDKNGNTLESPVDADNHHIDGIFYVVQKLFEQGIIKKI